MEFKEIPPERQSTRRQWQAAHYGLVDLAYAFGQHRIQVWYKEPHYLYPDVLWTQF